MTGTSDGETVSKTMTYTPGGMMETYSDGERVGEGKFKAYYINLDLGERIVPELVRIDKWIENDDS